MSIEIRAATADEMPQLGRLTAYAYAGAFGDGDSGQSTEHLRPEWTLCAFDGQKMVSSYATYPFQMRSAGRSMALAGITVVATAPEYRRRGIVRKIVTRAFETYRDNGQSIAGLWASQAAIYQRYGFVSAGVRRTYAIDTVDIAFADGDEGNALVERRSVDAAMDAVKTIYRDFVADRFGYLHRSQALWRLNVFDNEGGPVHLAVASRDGRDVGYVAYQLVSAKVDHVARGQEIEIKDLAWLDADAYRSLWQFLKRHDLVGRVRWETAPEDDPAMHLFREPRLLNRRDNEGSWMRIVDVSGALSARGYRQDGEIVLEVAEDQLAPWNTGRFRLSVEAGVGRVERVSAAPAATLSVGSLTSLFVGGQSAGMLAAMGQLSGDTAPLDALFGMSSKPHCPDHY